MTHENLKGRVAVVTGGGGVLCSGFAKDLAAQGAKVAVLDLRLEAAQKVVDEITTAGGTALAVACNVLEAESLEKARTEINEKLGVCDILINGAGGNSPLGTTTKDTLELTDIAEKAEGVKTFFDLDPKGIEFVFNLNFLGTLLTTQTFAKEMVGRKNEFLPPAHKNSGLLGSQGGGVELYAIHGGSLRRRGHPRQRHRARLLCDHSKQKAAF